MVDVAPGSFSTRKTIESFATFIPLNDASLDIPYNDGLERQFDKQPKLFPVAFELIDIQLRNRCGFLVPALNLFIVRLQLFLDGLQLIVNASERFVKGLKLFDGLFMFMSVSRLLCDYRFQPPQ